MEIHFSGELAVKTATWTNKTQIPHIQKQTSLIIFGDYISFLASKFAWKLIRQKLTTKNRLRRLGIDNSADCPF